MPEQQSNEKPIMRDVVIGGISILVIAILVFVGLALSHANDDYTCNDNSINTQQQSACSNGSWGPWTDVNGQEQRTYTGTQTTVAYKGGNIVSCSHPTDNSNGVTGTTGTITTVYAACQIVQLQTASSNGDNNNNNDNNDTNATSSQYTYTEVETTGAVINTSQATGSEQDYENAADAADATLNITATPLLVKPGATTQISWTSTYVNSCSVSGSNGDSWTGLQSPAGGETSSAINAQTIYTLTCLTGADTQITQKVTVDIIPTFQEQ